MSFSISLHVGFVVYVLDLVFGFSIVVIKEVFVFPIYVDEIGKKETLKNVNVI